MPDTNLSNQARSTVGGDQVGRDKIVTTNNVFVIKKELSPAIDPIRKYQDDNSDPDNTIMLKKLRDGKFSTTLIHHAIDSKARYLKLQIELGSTQNGRSFLEDAKQNLITVVFNKYLAIMNEGDTLIVHLNDIVADFSAIVEKYKGVISIDEAMVEGMLYLATSECAINWKIEGNEDA